MIRLAEKKDLPALKKVRVGISGEEIRERIRRQTSGELDYLVLEDQGELVSFVVLVWKGKETHPDYPDMVDLHTKESARGKGHGRELIAECERRARERGFKKIGLAVNPNLNPRAKGLYERLGYHHDGKKAYLDGVYNGVEDWVVDMEKEL